ncbi:MAG: aminotransferase class I/II-fold pyridoxal phosphate-dependent enzyme [Planctomycetes bacterium]|nr:aminotransferase class I/II-fold pyridoxal phosphate-dependent enzyme [Planctomycetota bacterium]
MQDHWIAERVKKIEMSGIRKVFELGRSLKDPVDLSIGQPHFEVPASIKDAAKAAIDQNKNGYTVTQGIPPLRERLLVEIRKSFQNQEREVLVTGGTSGALMLAMCATVNPGDEVILFDPYFVAYPHLVTLAGGTPVLVDTYPDFSIDLDRLKAALTPRTKVILFSSPANPTGAVVPVETLRELAKLADERGILLISDEIYRAFHHDGPGRSAAEFNPDVLVVDGFGKAYGMTGWRLGFAHGPKRLLDEMAKLQQFTFVCAPSIVQHSGVAALDFDVSTFAAEYRRKRDLMMQGLGERFEIVQPGGAFYVFPKAPWGTGTEFVAEAIKNNLLVIPGGTFSRRDTHFRISFAAKDETLQRGIEILNRISRR